MSVWSYAGGTLLFPKVATKGVKEIFTSFLGNIENNLSVELIHSYDNHRRFKVLLTFCEDGLNAATVFHDILGELKQHSAVDIDFNLEVRFHE